MKRKFFNFSLMASIGLLAFGVAGLSACNNSGYAAASVKLNVSEKTIGVGDSVQLKASHTKGYSGETRWFSSNESVAYVNESGLVFGVSEGEAIVTVAFCGGFADCKVVVSGQGGQETGDKVSITPSKKSVQIGDQVALTANVYPEDTTVEWKSSNTTVATVAGSGLAATVTTLAAGTVTITATGSNGKIGSSVITVKDGSGGGGGESGDERDIAVDKNLNYSGSMVVGSPLAQREFMESMLKKFNEFTNSSIKFTVTTFEEDNGVAGYNNAESMPAVFPYASDQTLSLSQFNALANVTTTDRNWIKTNMGEDAANAAKLGSTVGYPFASDNGVVMFYNKDYVSDPEQIDTLSEIFALAAQHDLEINYSVGTGFYAAGALMTYAAGKTFYQLTPKNTSYTAKSTFNCAEGIQAAKLINQIKNNEYIRNAATAPKGDVLVTITDVSKVQNFKTKEMGAKYAVAPVPYVDDAKTTRLGTFLGYKFYGVNNTLSDKTQAYAVAKFLCSEYVQAERFTKFQVRPTLTSLQDFAKDEPHIAALVEQSKNNGTVALTALPSEVWSETATAVTEIADLSSTADDAQYASILEALDKKLTKK